MTFESKIKKTLRRYFHGHHRNSTISIKNQKNLWGFPTEKAYPFKSSVYTFRARKKAPGENLTAAKPTTRDILNLEKCRKYTYRGESLLIILWIRTTEAQLDSGDKPRELWENTSYTRALCQLCAWLRAYVCARARASTRENNLLMAAGDILI